MLKRFWIVKIIGCMFAVLLVYGAIKLNLWLDSVWFK